jgi:hypothetical protein
MVEFSSTASYGEQLQSKCRYCGKEFSTGAVFCPSHGKQLADKAKPTPVVWCRGTMIESRIILLVFAFTFSLVSLFLPWAQSDGQIFMGLQDTFPLAFLYAIGLALSGISFFIVRRRATLSVLADIFVILGTRYCWANCSWRIGRCTCWKKMVPSFGVGLGLLGALLLVIVRVLQRYASENPKNPFIAR